MKKLIVLMFLLFPSLVYSANVCVSPAGSGNMSGEDWNNTASWSKMTFTRGNTYYLADGTYTYKALNTAVSGSTYIYIKKAIVTSHGPSTGWSNTMGDGMAAFPYIVITSSYWEFDGQVGQWASDMAGYVPYGFVVAKEGVSPRLFQLGASGNLVDSVHIRHVNAYYTNKIWTYDGPAQVYAYAGEDLQITHSWFHRAAQNNIYLITGNHTLFEYNVFEENASSQAAMGWNSPETPTMHAIIFRYNEHVSNSDFRYNVIRRWRSTGAIGLYSYNDNISIYGNVFVLDPGGDTDGPYLTFGDASARILDGATGANPPRPPLGYFNNVRIYNNTFADTGASHWVASGSFGDYSNSFAKNNIFYNVPFKGFYAGITASHNWYYNISANLSSEPKAQIGTGDPFINRSAHNFRLSTPTNAGDSSIGSMFKISPDGKIRGLDGNWDRGAYECNNCTNLKIPGTFPIYIK